VLDEAWSKFAQHISDLGRALPNPPFPQSQRDITDGYRYLTRLMVVGLQWAVEFGDPDFPAFYRHDGRCHEMGRPQCRQYLLASASRPAQ